MTPLLSVGELKKRLPPDTLPVDRDGKLDSVRIEFAIKEATGIIVTHLPWLLDKKGQMI